MSEIIEAFGKLGPVQSVAAAIVVVGIVAAIAWVLVRTFGEL